MTMTETTVPTKPKRKYAKRRKAAAPKQPKVPAEFAGLTPQTCCSACGEKGCIISGDVCAHPLKGGLQAAHMTKHEIVARYARARKALAQAKLDLTKEA